VPGRPWRLAEDSSILALMTRNQELVELVPDVSPEVPPGTWRSTLALMRYLPQGALSRAFGALADLPLPRRLRGTVLGGFARAVGADLEEAELSLSEYSSLNEFFTRRLRPGARNWPADPGAVGCPVDGLAGQVGRTRDGRLVQAKGRSYAAAELLADAAEAQRFADGSFATFYLSPRDYHRIHAPTGGGIVQAAHAPGALLPVNAAAVMHVPDLFARNERLICYLGGPLGRLAMVAVGAYNVGRISAAFDPLWISNRRGVRAEARRYDPAIAVERGDELMTFHLGSTVVLLFEPGTVVLDPNLRPGSRVRLGQAIARAA
jgi:phosphatidylserine decarboxylase